MVKKVILIFEFLMFLRTRLMEMPKENNKTPITKKSKIDQLISSDISIVTIGINNNDKQANGILNLSTI